MFDDAHKDLAQVSVVTAPNPATTGTTLGVNTSDLSTLPAAPFDATLVPNQTVALKTNAELIRVTAINATTGVLTIQRGKYGSTARSVAQGWQLIAGLSAAQLQAIVDAINGRVKGTVKLTVSNTAPTSPAVNDIWVDTSS